MRIRPSLPVRGVVPHLTMEITERMLLALPPVRETLDVIRKLGGKVALDDFCTGDSGLSHL